MNTTPDKQPIKVLLAEDDLDDCFLFEKALGEIPVDAALHIVNNGEVLMQYLKQHTVNLPDIVFMDLSMPRKTGFECLAEMNEDDLLKEIPVIVFTTSFSRGAEFESSLINTLKLIGAKDYIRKPCDFEKLKEIIYHTLNLYNSPSNKNIQQ